MNINDLWDNRELVLFVIQVLLFIVQVLSLGFLGLYVWKTWQMASSTRESAKASEKMIEEMKNARDQESAPYVIPYININKHMMYFGIKNVGRSVAKNIKIEFEPELMSSIFGEKIRDISLIKNGLSSLPPGHELSTFFDVSHIYLNRSDFPSRYLVKVSYEGGLHQKPRYYEQILDLSAYKDMIPDEDMNLDDVVKILKDLSKYDKKISEELEKIERNISKGIWIKNPELSSSYSQLDFESWKSVTISKLRELKAVLERMPKDSYSFSDENKNRIEIITSQIRVISSNYHKDANYSEELNSIAFNISEFTRSLIYKFGRESDGFDKEINKHVSEIDNLINKLI